MGHLPFLGSYNKAGNAIHYMDKNNFLKIFHKYQEGKATQEEIDFLENYYDLFDSHTDLLDSLSDIERQEIKMDIRTSVLEKIKTQELTAPRVRYVKSKFLRLAAASLLFMIMGATVLYFLQKPEAHTEVKMVAETIKENIVIYLPDGSQVILSAGSKLDYPASFDGLKMREVTLTGEAYFDIIHDASKPFKVHSGKLETIVLGTAFNIKAIDGQDNITVTVRRGKVKVMDEEKKLELAVITPNQQIVYNVQKVNSVLNSVDTEKYLTWMQEDLFCDNLTLFSAMELLEDRYNVKIEMADSSIGSNRFTTTFSKKEKIEDILETICLFNDLNYTYDSQKNSFIITKKN